jgi:MFS family permease
MRSRPKVFYGWWVVIVAALALFIGPAPLTVYSFGIFLKSLSADFHAGRAAISFAFTLHNFTSAIFAIVAGRLIDRFGARRVILPATACFGLILLSGKMLGGSIWHFYLFYLAMGLIIPGAGVVPYGIVISHWFNRLRGLALGLMMFGIGFGAIIIPTVAQRLIATFGWRMTYAIFGLAVLLIPLPVVGIFLKEDPAQNGLLPDGDAQQEMRTGERHAHGLDWPEIWHSPTYWLLISAFFLMGACVHACVLHMPSLLTDRGVSEQVAAIVSSVIGVAVLIGRVATGYLLDRFLPLASPSLSLVAWWSESPCF